MPRGFPKIFFFFFFFFWQGRRRPFPSLPFPRRQSPAPPRPELPPVPGLNARERDEFQDLSLKARSARESGGPQLTTEETQRYDALLKKAGQMDLLAEDRKSGVDADVKRLNDKANELRRQQGFSLNRAKRDEVSAYQRQIEAIEKQINDVRRSAEQGPAAAPEQGGLFSIGAESPSGRMVFAGPLIRLETVEQMRAAIDDPKSQISDEHKAVVKWMLDKGLLQQMPGLKLEVAHWIAGGRARWRIPARRRQQWSCPFPSMV